MKSIFTIINHIKSCAPQLNAGNCVQPPEQVLSRSPRVFEPWN